MENDNDFDFRLGRVEDMSDKYLIWSNEHRCWWCPNSRGYTRQIYRAGRYDRDEAIKISRGSGWPSTGIPDEIPVLDRDVIECFAPGLKS